VPAERLQRKQNSPKPTDHFYPPIHKENAMKPASAIVLILALSASCFGIAQSADMKDMKGMGNKPNANDSEAVTHKTTAVVKGVDAASGKVKLAHEPVKSLNWPAMTMGFLVRDPALFEKLAVGKKVEVEFVQQGSDYVVTAVK
jgi:Cu(I)/Ag(I) efflux system protein CusF